MKNASMANTRTTKSKTAPMYAEHFFGKSQLKTMVAHLSDDELGNDARRPRSTKGLYAAYKQRPWSTRGSRRSF